MKINLNDLSEEPRQYSGEEPADILGITEDRDVNVRGPVAYAFRVYVVSGVLIVRGTLQAPMAFRCSRCGKFYDADIRESGYELIFELPVFPIAFRQFLSCNRKYHQTHCQLSPASPEADLI